MAKERKRRNGKEGLDNGFVNDFVYIKEEKSVYRFFFFYLVDDKSLLLFAIKYFGQ